MKSFLDETDEKILKILQENGRITNADLAKAIELSPPSALQRVRRLERAGYILGYTALLDPEKLGYSITVWAMMSLTLHQDQPIERFRSRVMEVPEVVECYNVSGEYDFLLKILVADIRAYESLMRETLSRIEGVRQMQSSFVLGVTKHTTHIPV
ncbi:MAG TPA: Lrp/AsnC family transcriptional regulator [Fimbriimonadaceae bacterium]|nr:Lrp/AsnC family transcriptional regulator [Fimbriimonadaceae bacterium]